MLNMEFNNPEFEIKSSKKKQADNNLIKYLNFLLLTFSIIFVFGIFFGRIIFFPIEVQGVSMRPTLNADSLSGSTNCDIVYLGSTNNIKKGDIVVFDSGTFRDGKTVNYIKRVVGLPGDSISFKIYKEDVDYYYYDLYVNGIKQVESYIKEPMKISKKHKDDTELLFYNSYLISENVTILSTDEYFLMGDNRNNSLDCRFIGPINKSAFVGKVYLHIPYGSSIIQAIFKKIF